MSLIELPPELLDRIIEKTRPHGFEATAMTCKTIHAISKGYIHEHNRRKQMYRHLRLTERDQDGTGLIQQLLYFLEDPLAASYVETVRLAVFDESQSEDSYSQNDPALAILNRYLRQSPHLRFTQVQADAWCACMSETGGNHAQSAQRNYCTAIFLFMLPSLRKLSLPWHWGDIGTPPHDSTEVETDPGIWHVLEQLTSAANTRPSEIAPLGRLHTLLPYAQIDYDSFPRNALVELLPFMEMASVRNIYTTNCIAVDDSYTGIPFEWRHPEISSNLRTLELAGCCIDGDSISKVLPHTAQLKSLKYSHHTKWHGCQHDWDAGAFIHAVGQHLGATLTDLAVTIECMFGEIEHGVSSMKEFTALRTLELDVAVFCGPRLDSGEQAGMGGTGTPWTTTSLPSLDKILLPSIDIVDLYAGDYDGERSLHALQKLFATPPFRTAAASPRLIVRSCSGVTPQLEPETAEDSTSAVESRRRLVAAAGDAVRAGGAEWILAFGSKPRWRQAFDERCGVF